MTQTEEAREKKLIYFKKLKGLQRDAFKFRKINYQDVKEISWNKPLTKASYRREKSHLLTVRKKSVETWLSAEEMGLESE